MTRHCVLVALFCVTACRPGPSDVEPTIPDPDLSAMEPQVARLLTDLRQALADDPGLAEAWGELGATYDAHLLYDEAEVCYQEAVQRAPDDFRWRYLLAVVRDVNGADADEVARLFDAAAARRSDYAPLYLREGHALSLRGRYGSAREVLERALSLEPDLALAHRELGQVWLALGRPELALERLGRAAELAPLDGAVHATLVDAYRELGQTDLARRAAERAANLEPVNDIHDPLLAELVSSRGVSARHWIERAERLMEQGQWDRAIAPLELVREVRPRDAHVYYSLGTANARSGRPQEAESLLSRALELDPGHVGARIELAALAESRGRPDEALRQLRQARLHAPGDAEVLARLAGLLARMGDARGVIEVYEELANVTVLEARDYSNWGNALTRVGRIDEALGRYRKALELDPDHANTHYNLGLALERLGREDEAREHYLAAARIDPKHPAGRRLGLAAD